MIEVHINPYNVQKQEINVGHLKDHKAYKIIFDELEGSNYQLKVKINNSFEQFPITNNEWIITSSYTQKSPLTIQVVEVVEDNLIYHGEEITLNLKSSIRNDGQIIEVVPPAYQSKFDELVKLTNDIKTSYEIGEFKGEKGDKGDVGPQGPAGSGGTTNYNDLKNKPQINGVELSGNKSGNDIGLVNNQQGTANAGKILGIGQDGLVIPIENAGASDNIIYKDVPKQLNPNVTDSFQRAMWNLKMYGQSTQGADPSPTNKQDITAISKFEGAPTGGNIVDWNIEQWNDNQKQALNPIITNDGLSINCNNLTTALTPTIFGQYNVNSLKLDTSKKYIASCNLTNANISIIIRTSSGQISLTSSNKKMHCRRVLNIYNIYS